jgi:hypothetical protein
VTSARSAPLLPPGRVRRLGSAAAALTLLAAACAPAAPPYAGYHSPLAPAESLLQQARLWDDQLRLTRSLGADRTPAGLPAGLVRDSLRRYHDRLVALLSEEDDATLVRSDVVARATLRKEAADLADQVSDSANTGNSDHSACPPHGTSLSDLTTTVMACYGREANRIMLDGETLTRLEVLGRIPRTADAARRKRLFRSLEPLWRSVNGDDGPESPYRRLLHLRDAAWSQGTSPVESKGQAFGLDAATLEQWFVRALAEWRDSQSGPDAEPWDWYYDNGAASRQLSPRVPTIADLMRINNAFYRGIGADPRRLDVHYDLLARPAKYPVAFTDFGSRNHWAGRRLLPGQPWIFASYQGGGLDNLAELMHETGHAIHIAAIRTRPAYLDWPDSDTFTEALADLPAMELYEPEWQQRVLGDSVPLSVSLRAKYSGVVLDLAWALFELRVHENPRADPNLVWSAITHDYLHIQPHPEWSWWAMRGQLIDAPGYLINYALAAFIVADLREAVRRARGRAAWSDPTMYAWLSNRIYRFGLERSSREVMEDVLGRPLSPDALLRDLGRLRP